MATNLFNRYVWLVDTIKQAERISFEQINRKWLQNDWSEGQTLPLRTFHNHRTKVEELFNINIECDGHNQYFIATDLNSDLRNWLLNTFSVSNLIQESYTFKDRILFEEIPSGHLFLSNIIKAIRDGITINFDYKPFWYHKILDIEIEPYCIKIFKQRWYVLGRNTAINEMRLYGLDRMESINGTITKFKLPKNFDASTYFENAFGIVVSPKIEPCDITIRVFGNRRNFLQTLPLHHSQQEMEQNGESSVFRYYLAPKPDFFTGNFIVW